VNNFRTLVLIKLANVLVCFIPFINLAAVFLLLR